MSSDWVYFRCKEIYCLSVKRFIYYNILYFSPFLLVLDYIQMHFPRTNAWGTKLFLKTYCSSLIGFTSGDTVSGDSEADSGVCFFFLSCYGSLKSVILPKYVVNFYRNSLLVMVKTVFRLRIILKVLILKRLLDWMILMKI